jgi:pimeloyl-ACP methyl ester carboxylesterase
MRLFPNCLAKLGRFNGVSSSSLHSSLSAAVPATGLIGASSDPLSLDYPDLFAPLKTTAAACLSFALVVTVLFAHFRPFQWEFFLLRLFKLFPFLKKVKPKISKVIVAVFVALLTNQEVQLQDSLLVDFRTITKGFWSTVDNVIMHYLRCISPSATASSLHMFHGFGANSLSWQPIMKLFGIGCVSAVAHDIPGFGFNPRVRTVPDSVSYPTIYRPLWNARASLILGDNLVVNELGKRTSSRENPVILMGHSMGSIGSIAAAAAVLYDSIQTTDSADSLDNKDVSVTNKRSVTLVLVDPALTFSAEQKGKSPLKSQNNSTDPGPNSKQNSLNILEKVATAVRNSELVPDVKPKKFGAISFLVGSVSSILQLPMKIILRRFVHTDWLWQKGLTFSNGEIGQISKEDIFRYKLASMAKAFDTDFIDFAEAQKGPVSSVGGASFASCIIVPGVTQEDLLASLVDLGCKVVILHGTVDRVIPYKSSVKMVQLVQQALDLTPLSPGIQLVPLKGFGHCPHEEDPNFFLKNLAEIGIIL